jgi:hypothetical protein
MWEQQQDLLAALVPLLLMVEMWLLLLVLLSVGSELPKKDRVSKHCCETGMAVIFSR